MKALSKITIVLLASVAIFASTAFADVAITTNADHTPPPPPVNSNCITVDTKAVVPVSNVRNAFQNGVWAFANKVNATGVQGNIFADDFSAATAFVQIESAPVRSCAPNNFRCDNAALLTERANLVIYSPAIPGKVLVRSVRLHFVYNVCQGQ